MEHLHSVIDSDVYFLIDPVSREVSNQDSGKVTLTKGDHNSERYTFSIPRYVEGHDMSLCNVVRIHYINTNASTRAQKLGTYEVSDLRLDSEDSSKVIFTWLVSRESTMYVGALAFSIEFSCFNGNKLLYSWNTLPYSGISITDGINNSEYIAEEYADVLQTWWERLYSTSSLPIEVHTTAQLKELQANGDVKEDTLYLLEDDPTLKALEELQLEQNVMKSNIKANTSSIDQVSKDCQANFNFLNEATSSRLTDHRQRIEALEDRADTVDTSIDTINEQLSTATTDITKLKDDVEALDLVHASLTDTVTGATTDITNLEKAVEALETGVADFETGVNNRYSSLESKVNKLIRNVDDFYKTPEYGEMLYGYGGNKTWPEPRKISTGVYLLYIKVYGPKSPSETTTYTTRTYSTIMNTAYKNSSSFYDPRCGYLFDVISEFTEVDGVEKRKIGLEFVKAQHEASELPGISLYCDLAEYTFEVYGSKYGIGFAEI